MYSLLPRYKRKSHLQDKGKEKVQEVEKLGESISLLPKINFADIKIPEAIPTKQTGSADPQPLNNNIARSAKIRELLEEMDKEVIQMAKRTEEEKENNVVLSMIVVASEK